MIKAWQIGIVFFLLLYINVCFPQTKYPKDYFTHPLKNTFVVLSNFGDIRANHFHTGIDLRTGEGTYLYSAADGYVSRIKVSPIGYGKALYITHPNGYTTVYGHLKKYSEKIEEYIKRAQYENHDFAVELFPRPDELEICKQEIIGLSGNTGLSTGPHLHFEIRDTKTEHIINPLLFYKFKDNFPPTIFRIHIYPLDKKSSANSKNSRQSFDVKVPRKKYGKPALVKGDNIVLSGRIGFGIESYDTDNESKDRSNIYSVEIVVDTSNIYSCQFEEFSFDDKRNVNSYIDYKEYYTRYRNIQRCFVEPNNKTPIYTTLLNQGIFDFNSDAFYTVKIKVKDINGNTTKLDFKVKGTKEAKEFIEEKDEYAKMMPYEEVNYFIKDDIMISFPEDIFYDTLLFDYKKYEPQKGFYSPVHNIHNKFTPLNKKIVLSIRTDSVPSQLMSKALIVSISKNGTIASIGGQLKEKYITAETFEFGSYAIVADTTPPEIKPENIADWEDITCGKTIKFKITDNLSGVKNYAGFIDGRWILFEYDKKFDLAVYTFDDPIVYGEPHTIEFFVEDEKGNKAYYCSAFYR
ncbi:MAG: M23 family metallopeptidase [Bacteroidia bacterium]|nr:M23 family metallopeptidase [Bacteroidia bacterium]